MMTQMQSVSTLQCYYRELERNKNKNDYIIVLPNKN